MSDIDYGSILEALNEKADLDLGNVTASVESAFLKSDLSNSPQGVDFVVNYYSNGSDWYRVYKSGWVEQGGICDVAKDTSYIINLPIEMVDDSYSILLTHLNAILTSSSSGEITASEKLLTSFKLNYGKDSASQVCWRVSGMSSANES